MINFIIWAVWKGNITDFSGVVTESHEGNDMKVSPAINFQHN